MTLFTYREKKNKNKKQNKKKNVEEEKARLK